MVVVFYCLCWGGWLDTISFLELGVKSKAFSMSVPTLGILMFYEMYKHEVYQH
jgi:hypothetical protein